MTRTHLLLAMMLLFAVPAPAQTAAPADSTGPANTAPVETPKTPEPAKPDMTMTKMASGPPAELKKLDVLIGTWTAQSHAYAGPNGPAKDYTGKTTYKLAFDGMHLEGDHRFQMAGKPETGRSTWSWDPERNQYQIVWTSSAFPVSYVYYGTFSTDTTLVLFGTSMLRGKAITDKMTYTFSGRNEFTFVVESDMSGAMQKTLEEKDKRASSAATKPAAKKSSGASTKKSG